MITVATAHMRKQSIFLLSFLISLSTASHLSCTVAYADKGVTTYFPSPEAPYPSPKPLSAGVSQNGPLQGGIKQESPLNPSLRLTPQYQGRVDSSAIHGGPSLNPMKGQYVPEQIRGSVHTGGTDGGISDGPVQFLGDTVRGGNNGMHGVISPISTYHRTPASGVINYIPGTSASFAGEDISQNRDNLPQHYKTVGRGVVVLDPALTVSSMPKTPAVPMFGGTMPGSALSSIQQTLQNSIQMVGPGMNTAAVVRSSLPGDNETHYVTRNGVTTAPGFEVTITPPGLTRETLGGRWSTNPPISAVPVELSAVPGTMQSQHIFTRIEPAAEVAKAGVLAQFQAGTCETWPQWYRAMARTIYTHWQMVDVCPGATKLEVTVKADHEISGRVIEFTPAADIERNVPRETQFRETAVQIVNQIGFFEVPDFPKTPNSPATNQVVFDIDLKRTVDGPTGISVVGVPAPPKSQK
ncbi:MAG: hypothetical protein JSS83_15550 [Cyanobacteria bacterium SZAS LIN-3]|nr:hypothetical protein [Cyanobacteria bacterium SZAS LIN-3]